MTTKQLLPPPPSNQGGDPHQALFKWAKRVLEEAGLLQLLRNAKTRAELDSIKFDDGNVKLIVAIREALRLGSGKKPKKDFHHLKEASLRKILRNRFEDAKKDARKKLIESEQQAAADEQAQEEDVKFYGEFGQYKARDRGVFVRTIEELPTGESITKWLQISRTRIELIAVTRSREDDHWGVYITIKNMDGRVTRLAIPRSIINDKSGTIAGRLASLGADIVREQRELLPDFLLTRVELVDGNVQDLMRFMAVPTTGWYKLKNGKWVFVLPDPDKTKFPADLFPTDSTDSADLPELAIFQTERLHLKHGFAISGTVDEWREQILESFGANSNVTLAVGSALSGPVTVWAGVPPGIFHIFCDSKHGKSARLGRRPIDLRTPTDSQRDQR